MKTSFKFLYTGIAGLIVATGFAVTPAIAELSNFKPPTNSVTSGYGGFPQWYRDTRKNGNPGPLRLELCVDANNPLCLAAPPPDPNAAISFPDNFPDEAFWWAAEASTTTTSGAKALLVMATEAAFANGDVFDGDQIVFNRTRIRILGGLTAGKKYRITYPYGVKNIVATAKGNKPATINVTEDFGCAVTATTECNFADLTVPSGNRGRLLNPIGKPWLTWDPAFAPAAPVVTNADGTTTSYIGDPGVDHKVIGSPIAVPISVHPSGFQNFFKVEELNDSGTPVAGPPIAYTDLFSVSGKIFEKP